MDKMKDTLDYVFALQAIAHYRADTDDYTTPYQLEMRRQAMHQKLFDNVILPTLHLADGFTEHDAFLRSKELFSHLDRIWGVYDRTPFNLQDDDCVSWLALYIDKYLSSTEAKYYLEGVTNFTHSVIIKED